MGISAAKGVADARPASCPPQIQIADVCVMRYHGGAYGRYDAIRRRDGSAQGLPERRQAPVRVAFRGSSYTFSLAHALPEEVISRIVSLLQWQDFLHLGQKFAIPVSQPLADVQSSSISWLREKCATLGVEEYVRCVGVLRWFLGLEYAVVCQSGSL